MPSRSLTSPIVTVSVGRDGRLFAAHEDVLCHSYYFAHIIRSQFWTDAQRQITLPDEEPEIFSAVLEYLYKGDYTPRLVIDKKRGTWSLEQTSQGLVETTVPSADGTSLVPVLRDTVVYCVAHKYGLEELQRLALRKQGLQSGVQCATILASARYAYAHTPDSDSKLRAHYLALIIRSRHTFKRSGTMQNEMEAGGKLFFDLFVAMVNHMDDLQGARR
ncbi:MAG: BTB/POZ domain-containing protein [Terriglobus roseus]|nr:BTB/POZ domain-containing protein [Terriglobus roseus]